MPVPEPGPNLPTARLASEAGMGSIPLGQKVSAGRQRRPRLYRAKRPYGAAGGVVGAATGCELTINSSYQVWEIGPADTVLFRFVQYASSVIMSNPGDPLS